MACPTLTELPSGLNSASSVEPGLRVEDIRAAVSSGVLVTLYDVAWPTPLVFRALRLLQLDGESIGSGRDVAGLPYFSIRRCSDDRCLLCKTYSQKRRVD